MSHMLLDVAWFAGVYEGEGSINRVENTYVMTVSQRDRWLCDRIQSLFGGVVGGPYKGNGNRISYQWRAGTKRSVELAHMIYPFLSPRRIEQFRRLGIPDPPDIQPSDISPSA